MASAIMLKCLGEETKGHNLPQEYQEAEYIMSNDPLCDINTEFVYVNSPKIETSFKCFPGYTSDADIFGTPNGTGGNLILDIYQGRQFYYRYGSTTAQNFDLPILRGDFVEFSFGQTMTYKGNNLLTYNEYDFSANTQSIHIFKARTGYAKVGFKYFKIFDGDIIKREMYPCYRKSDNTIGMFDKVSNRFFTNTGSGTLVVGSDVF